MSKVTLDDFLITINAEDFGIFEGYYDDFQVYVSEDEDFAVEGTEDENDMVFESFDNYLVRVEELTCRMYEIYNNCLSKPKTLDSVEDCVEGHGFTSNVLFSSSKLDENRENIKEIVDGIFLDEDYVSDVDVMKFGRVGYDWDENLIANVEPEMEMLIQLGSAIGELSILRPVSELNDGDCLYVFRTDANTDDKSEIYCKK